MDQRLKILAATAALLAGLVVVVLAGRGGGDISDEPPPVRSKPDVEVPSGDPPSDLVVDDIEQGDGAEAKAGDQLSVNYVGVLYDGGKEFDSSYDRGQPLDFQLGAGMVIPGWDQGLVGMKVGGRRQLTIPPNLAYGPQGQAPDIPKNATLVFVIDLLSIG